MDIQTVYGAHVGQILPDRCYWAAKTKQGRWFSELDMRIGAHGMVRSFDWTLDLVDLGEHKNLSELWLFCPPSATSPQGNTARLPITEPATGFQFKVATLNGMLAMEKSVEAQIIGRVTDRKTGECECFIWDYSVQGLYTPDTLNVDPYTGTTYHPCRTNVQHFESWREGIAPIGALALHVLGVELEQAALA